MSILKSILHRWDKDSKSYDTLHPETEVAQITDFADGIVSKLAATTAISAISALQTDSWFGKMMKWVLDASGVKYLIDTNGYVCFGSLFGGLIIQWGTATTGTNTNLVHLPVTMQNWEYAVLVQNIGKLQYKGFWQVYDRTVNDFRIYNSMPGDNIGWFWECIGK